MSLGNLLVPKIKSEIFFKFFFFPPKEVAVDRILYCLPCLLSGQSYFVRVGCLSESPSLEVFKKRVDVALWDVV